MELVDLIRCSTILKIERHLIKNPEAINKIHNGGMYMLETPLVYAIEYSDVKIVKLLLDYGADPNMCIHNRLSPLDCSIMSTSKFEKSYIKKGYIISKRRKVKLLLEYGANPNLKYKHALYNQCYSSKVMQILLEYDKYYKGKEDKFVLLTSKINLLNTKN